MYDIIFWTTIMAVALLFSEFIMPNFIVGLRIIRAGYWARKVLKQHYGTWFGVYLYTVAVQRLKKESIEDNPSLHNMYCFVYVTAYNELKNNWEGLTK